MSAFEKWLHIDADCASTHPESCYEYHPKCALIALAPEMAEAILEEITSEEDCYALPKLLEIKDKLNKIIEENK